MYVCTCTYVVLAHSTWTYSSPQKKVSVSIRSVSILLKRNGRCVPLQRSRPFRSVLLDRKMARQFALAAGFFEFTVHWERKANTAQTLSHRASEWDLARSFAGEAACLLYNGTERNGTERNGPFRFPKNGTGTPFRFNLWKRKLFFEGYCTCTLIIHTLAILLFSCTCSTCYICMYCTCVWGIVLFCLRKLPLWKPVISVFGNYKDIFDAPVTIRWIHTSHSSRNSST